MTTLGKLFRLPFEDQVLLLEAVFLNVAVWVIVQFLPWWRALGLLRAVPALKTMNHPPERIAWIVHNACHPFPFSTCLTRALVLHHLLQRGGYKSSIQIGVTKGSDDGFEAHAWVEHRGKPLANSAAELVRYSPLFRIESTEYDG